MTSGDISSAEIYLKYRDGLTRFATVMVGPNDANDVISTVVTRVLASGKQLDDLNNPQAYLMQAVVNESRTVLRRGSRTAALVDSAVVDAAPQPEVLEAVMRLPHRQRAATYLVFWVGMSSREAGTLLGCRPATVRRYLLLAKRKLRGVLHDED